MRKDIEKLLRASDDSVGSYVPGDDWASFPYYELANSVEEVKAALQKATGVEFDRDGNAQDASFHDELRILSPESYLTNRVTVYIPEIGIRFSNFGRLFTIHSAFDKIPKKYPVQEIQEIVEAHGWIFIPADKLKEPYDGVNVRLRDYMGLGNKVTWWIRFFDYI